MNHALDHIVAALKAAREKKGMSQRELSSRTGLPQPKISNLESGSVDPRLSSLVALARALDLEIELVPRRALPAVETIVRSAERREVTKTTANEVRKLASALQSIGRTPIPRGIIDQTLNQLRMIEHFPLSAEQLEAIQKFNAVLKLSDADELDPATLNRHIKSVSGIRNQLAHNPPPALPPRPAYSLDDDEEEEDNA
ncbi:MAG: helix-turn-helix domain-containing protein [Alphaproteobacteria bacterium]|nr:helix-turn-helix domain-containing protein [Alphaproteobacteria bacterium]